jgi:phage terminase large subunit
VKPTKVFFDILRAYHDGYRNIVLKGSARSSKTVSAIQSLDFIADGSSTHKKISITSQSFPHLREGAIYEYERHQAREGILRHHNKSEHSFSVNKSIINYFEADPVKAIGPGRNICYINEANKGVTFQTYTDLKTRTTECMIMDYNPSGPFWLQEEGIINDPRTILLHSTWLDNIKNLSPEQIEDFIDAKRKSKTSEFWNYWWKVYGLGEDAVLMEERIMPFIKRASKVPKDAIEIPSALDFGFFPDPTSFNRMWIKVLPNGREQLYIKQVVYQQKLSVNTKSPNQQNLTELLIAKGVNPLHLIIAESADPRAVEEMKQEGFSIEAVRKTTIESSIRLFHDYDIFIVDGSEEVYTEFDNYRYDRSKKNIITGIPAKGQKDHAIDGCRYVLLSRNARWSI